MDVTRLLATTAIPSALFLLIVQPLAAQTRQYLDAPVVKSNIRVRLSGKDLQWAADEDSRFRSLQSDALFLTKRSVFVTYPRMNPLKIQASASAKAVDDPAAATIGKLVESVAKVATTLAPTTADAGLRDAGAAALRAMNAPLGLRDAPPFACDAAASAEGNFKALSSLLYGEDSSAKTVGSHVSDWTNQIDESFRSGKSGPTTIADVAKSMKAVMDGLTSNIDAAKKISAKIGECASDSWKPAETESSQVRQKQLYLAASLTKATTDIRIKDLQSLKAALAQLIDPWKAVRR